MPQKDNQKRYKKTMPGIQRKVALLIIVDPLL